MKDKRPYFNFGISELRDIANKYKNNRKNGFRNKGGFKLNRLILWLWLGFFATQLYGSENTLYEEVIYNKPDVGSITKVFLGDRMLTQQVGKWKECITPKQTVTKTKVGWTATYKADKPMCKPYMKSKFYTPTYQNWSGHGQAKFRNVLWQGKKDSYSLCGDCPMWSCYKLCVKKLPRNFVIQGETFIYKQNSFQQTIEYAGRSGDILKFNYSEFTGGFARQAFSREFQVDLSKGNVAAYKGAIIIVIDATNIQIEYNVLRNFSEL